MAFRGENVESELDLEVADEGRENRPRKKSKIQGGEGVEKA